MGMISMVKHLNPILHVDDESSRIEALQGVIRRCVYIKKNSTNRQNQAVIPSTSFQSSNTLPGTTSFQSSSTLSFQSSLISIPKSSFSNHNDDSESQPSPPLSCPPSPRSMSSSSPMAPPLLFGGNVISCTISDLMKI